jgi:hypothetical protein
VAVAVPVAVGVLVGAGVGVLVAVGVGVGVLVRVGVRVGVLVGVDVGGDVPVGVAVFVTVGVGVALLSNQCHRLWPTPKMMAAMHKSMNTVAAIVRIAFANCGVNIPSRPFWFLGLFCGS